MKLSFIGGGNMASALIGGLLQAERKPQWIQVSDPNPRARKQLQESYGIRCFEQTADAIKGADVVVLAVKPQIMPLALQDLKAALTSDQLVISIAAGITVDQIQQALGGQQPVVRSMPNTPALIRKGISGLFAGPACDATHIQQAEQVLAGAGAVVWVDEEGLMDVVTAVSGSGPAYFFLLTEALRDAGQALGLTADAATQLAVHTACGAGAMALNPELDVAELRRRVTSPGGTTHAAIEVFEQGDLRALVLKAVTAASDRGRELASGANAL